jgi:hypothetical protein
MKNFIIIAILLNVKVGYSQLAKVTLKSGNTYPVSVLAFTKDSIWTNIVPSIITNHPKKQIKKIILNSGKIIDKDNISDVVSTEEELDKLQILLDSLDKDKSMKISTRRKEPPFINNDTLITQSGYRIKVGDIIRIGNGSTNDGDFKFIRINEYSMFRYFSRTEYNGLANAANAFPRSETGFNYIINEISVRGDDKYGYVGYAKIKRRNTLINYEIDVESAFAANEIIVKDNRKPKNVPASEIQKLSIADEILKIKKLYDEGVLTKEEFEVLKKKIIEN